MPIIDSRNMNTIPIQLSSTREILTAMDVAKMLKVSRVTVYRMAGRGEIPCYRNGSLLMFYKDEILRWVDSTRINK